MLLPPRLLSVTVTDVQPESVWTEDDGSGDPWIGFPYRWTVTFDITPQSHSSHRTTVPFFYTGNDVAVGDWLGFLIGGTSVRIVQIISQAEGLVTAVCEDVDRFNVFIDPSQQGVGIGSPGAGFLFQLSDDGLPVLAPMTAYATTLNLNVAWQLDQISRFAYRNLIRSYFRVEQAGHTLAVGDVVRIRTEAPNIGTYEKVVQGQTVEGVVGVVNSIGTPGVNWFTYRPSGRVVTNLTPALPGTAGSLIYLDNSGAYTTTRPSAFAKPIFIRLTGDGSIGLQVDRNVDPVAPTVGYIAQTYVVATIAERDLLTGINEGDQVKVRDSGNGEWRQFIYDNGTWVLMVTQDASDTDAETLDATVTPAAPTGVLGTLSNDSSITVVTINIIESFDGNASLTVGTPSDPDAFMGGHLSDLSQPGIYAAAPSVVVSGETTVTYTLTTNGTQGSAIVSITYV